MKEEQFKELTEMLENAGVQEMASELFNTTPIPKTYQMSEIMDTRDFNKALKKHDDVLDVIQDTIDLLLNYISK